MKNSSLGKKILSVILALLLGLCASGAIGALIPSCMYLSALSVLSSLLLAFLYGFAGMLPVIVMALSMLVSGFVFGSWMIPAYLTIVDIVPGAVMIWGSRKGVKFFYQVRNALIAELIVFVVLLSAIRMITGQDFASFFKAIFDEMIMALSPEEQSAFAEYLNQIINPETAFETEFNTENILAFFSDGMEQTLSIMMPVALILYSFVNGAIGVLWMNWLRYRHGEENVQFVPLRGWRLSKQITLGLLIVFVAVLIVGNKAQEAGVSAKIMVVTAIVCAACIQASASFLSRLSMMGVSAKKRTLFLIVFFLISMVYFPFYGIMSALFGSKGLFVPKIRMVNHNGMPERPEDDVKNEEDKNNEKEDE